MTHPPGVAPAPVQTVLHPPSLPHRVAADWPEPSLCRQAVENREEREHTQWSALTAMTHNVTRYHRPCSEAGVHSPFLPSPPTPLPSPPLSPPPLVLEHTHHQLYHKSTGQYRCARSRHSALLVQGAVTGRLGKGGGRERGEGRGQGQETHRSIRGTVASQPTRFCLFAGAHIGGCHHVTAEVAAKVVARDTRLGEGRGCGLRDWAVGMPHHHECVKSQSSIHAQLQA